MRHSLFCLCARRTCTMWRQVRSPRLASDQVCNRPALRSHAASLPPKQPVANACGFCSQWDARRTLPIRARQLARAVRRGDRQSLADVERWPGGSPPGDARALTPPAPNMASASAAASVAPAGAPGAPMRGTATVKRGQAAMLKGETAGDRVTAAARIDHSERVVLRSPLSVLDDRSCAHSRACHATTRPAPPPNPDVPVLASCRRRHHG